MISANELVNAGVTGTGVKLDWENPVQLPDGTRTVPSLVNGGITGTGVRLDWLEQYHITCRFSSPVNAPADPPWLGRPLPLADGLTVVRSVPTPDGLVHLVAYASDAELVKRYARTLAESAASTPGTPGVRVEVTDADHQPICEVAI